MLRNERPYREFAGEALRQGMQHLHRGLDMCQAILRHKHRVRQVNERGQALAAVTPVGLIERLHQDRHSLRIVGRQMLPKRLGDLLAPRHQPQRLVTQQRIAHKALAVERWMHRQNHAGNGAWHIDTKLFF